MQYAGTPRVLHGDEWDHYNSFSPDGRRLGREGNSLELYKTASDIFPLKIRDCLKKMEHIW